MRSKQSNDMVPVLIVFGLVMMFAGNYWRLSPVDWPSHVTACYLFAISTLVCVTAIVIIAIALVHELAMEAVWRAEKNFIRQGLYLPWWLGGFAIVRKIGLRFPWWIGWLGGLAIIIISVFGGLVLLFNNDGLGQSFEIIVLHQIPLSRIGIIVIAVIGATIGHAVMELHTKIHWVIYGSKSWIF